MRDDLDALDEGLRRLAANEYLYFPERNCILLAREQIAELRASRKVVEAARQLEAGAFKSSRTIGVTVVPTELHTLRAVLAELEAELTRARAALAEAEK